MTETSRFVVSSDWLQTELGSPDLRIVDASFYLPAQNRDAAAIQAKLVSRPPGVTVAAVGPRPGKL